MAKLKNKRASIKRVFSNIAWLCKPYWREKKLFFILYILFGVTITPIQDFIYVYFPKQIVDMLTRGDGFRKVATYALGILLISYILIILPIAFQRYFVKSGKFVNLKIKRSVYEQALGTDYRFIDNPEYYDKYVWALDEYAEQSKAAREQVKLFFTLLASIGVLFSLIAATAPWILALEAVQLFFHARIYKYQNPVQVAYKDALVPSNRRLNYIHRLFYQQQYTGDLKMSELPQKVFRMYDDASEEGLGIINTYEKKLNRYDIIHETLLALTELIIILYVIYLIASGRISEVGQYIALTLAFYRIDEKLIFLLRSFAGAHELSLNAEKIREFFAIEPEIEKPAPANALVPAAGSFSLKLENVHFAYPDSDFSLSDIDLEIRPGEKIVIVGENGAGKSTLMKLLLRLYDVSDGAVRVNGEKIQDYDIHALRKQIGVAFQTSNVYAMTYAENLAFYGKPSQEAMAEVTEKLGLTTIFEKNRADFDRELTREFSEDGIMVSGGEIQKIALARIMTKDFGLLLLDEPSSALDPISEDRLIKILLGEANKTTTILISHRLSTVRDADRILLIREGKIAEAGTHDELMALKGDYYEMFTTQAEHYVA